MAGEKEQKFELPNDTVEIRYIKKQTGTIVDPKHIAYGGLLEDKGKAYRRKMLENGNFANLFTKEEKDYLEKVLGLPDNNLSVYNKVDNYLDKVKITIKKEGIFLNLNDPEDYIKYKMIIAYDDSIAPNISAINEKATYKFVVVRKNDEAKLSLKKLDATKEAYKLYGKIEDDREQMIDFLMINNIKVAEDTTAEWLSAEVGKLLVNSPAKFVEILKDPSYKTRVLLGKALQKGEVTKRSNGYYSKDGSALAEPNQTPSLQSAIDYIENNINQEYKLLLISKTNKK